MARGVVRAGLLAGVLLCALGAARLGVAAPTYFGHPGHFALIDTATSPGATCRFALPLDWSLGGVWLQARPPVAFARNVTPSIDEQQIGWRVVVSRQTGSVWAPFEIGPEQRVRATDNRVARFDERGPGTSFFLPTGTYRVESEITWYGDDGVQTGMVRQWVSHYAIALRDRWGTHPRDVAGKCTLGR